MILKKMSVPLLRLEPAAMVTEAMEFVPSKVIAAANGGIVGPQPNIAMMILLRLLLATWKEHHRLLPTLLMLASVLLVTSVTASALMNLTVAATGDIAELVRTTASPRGFLMKIVVNHKMEPVVAEVSAMAYAILDYAVHSLDFVARATFIVQDKMVLKPTQLLMRAKKSSTILLYLMTSDPRSDFDAVLRKSTREATASLLALITFNAWMEKSAGAFN
mmetsp:Transcript_33156/g.56317  ORF Transcript_33156/g.56317 Transcript_33156/m.56317 type:complete len:219 (+) Transcript_33156:1175-1831(+)